MGVVQVQLPDNLKQVIDRQVAEGRAASEAEYVVEVLRLYADHLDAEDEITAMVERADVLRPLLGGDGAGARIGTLASRSIRRSPGGEFGPLMSRPARTMAHWTEPAAARP